MSKHVKITFDADGSVRMPPKFVDQYMVEGSLYWELLAREKCTFTYADILQKMQQWADASGQVFNSDDLRQYGVGAVQWAHYAFPLIDIASHKYCAALATTDAPEVLQLPWPVFIVRIPAGLLVLGGKDGAVDVTNLLCVTRPHDSGTGTVVTVALYSTLYTSAPLGIRFPLEQLAQIARADFAFEKQFGSASAGVAERAIAVAVRIICSAATALLATPSFSDASRQPQGRKGADTTVVPQTRRFVIGRSISADFRDAVRSYVSGVARELRPIQWIVRGHWRQQPVGAGREGRVLKWIEPHWARRAGAPDDAPINARAHVLREDVSR